MKKLLALIIILIIIVGGAFLYATRPASAPSQDINSVIDTTPTAQKTYRISQDESRVDFRIGEILNDKPFQVLGTTTQIAGDIGITDGKVSVGTLAINARTFSTDNARRDGAIARFILKSEDAANEFITFKPESITGLAGNSATGTVSGNLTIAGVTKPATFLVSMSMNGNKLTATSSVTISRSDYNLVIPSVKSVASVDETLTVVTKVTAYEIAQ